MTSIRPWALVVCLALAAGLGCGAADLGEQCDTSNSTDECVDGAVCTNEADGVNRCRKLCTTMADCPAMTSCNGISGGSNKSCQPD